MLYLFSIMAAFLLGGFFAVLIRLELLRPTEVLIGADAYNQVFTLHGAIMIFLFIIPSIRPRLETSFCPR